MGKSDFLTPKAIGNRIKAKGLQKLRWFCQVCQKQCRDENGFKCHTSSESHQRQMLIVANNPDKFLSEYSDEFERSFLENLRRRHGTKRMAANVVYNEYIADKLHIHMNATQWTTLGTFVQYLGRTGKCVVDETEKGWFLQYIDRDPRTLARQEEMDKKHKAELDHEERNRLFIERQLKVAKEGTSEQDEVRPTKMQRRDGDEKITLSLKPSTSISTTSGTTTTGKDKATASKSQPLNVFAFGDASASSGDYANGGNSTSGNTTNKRRAIDALTHEFEERRAKEQDQKQRRDQPRDHAVRLENWITTGIIVKVLNKKVANGDYYKLKGEIIGVKDRFGATVEMLDSRDVLQLDQDDLETVIPKVGRRVKIVNGVARGSVAKLLSINVDDFCVSVRIDSGSRRGDVLDRVEYEDVSRLADDAQPHERR